MSKSASSINVLTERDQVMPPNSGYHLSIFVNYTLDRVKVTLMGLGLRGSGLTGLESRHRGHRPLLQEL